MLDIIFLNNNLVNTWEIYIIMQINEIRSYSKIRMFGRDGYFLEGECQECYVL